MKKRGVAAKHQIKRAIFAANHRMGNYRNAVWLIGDGRSGTTWVADLVSQHERYRQLFEPFHPQLVKPASFLKPHQYMRPETIDTRLQALAAEVFSGRFTDRHVDQPNRALWYRGLLIKDIFANLFAYWASLRFPMVKIILLIRNPFAVALSKSRKKSWYWLTEPLDLLAQRSLREDFLGPFEDTIRETSAKGNYVLNQILIWAIINYVPLRQFGPERLHVVFYEDVYASPSRQVAEILGFVRPVTAAPQVDIDPKLILQPSWVSGPNSAVARGLSPVALWKQDAKSRDIDAGLMLLERFGLAELYDDYVQPNRERLRVIRGRA